MPTSKSFLAFIILFSFLSLATTEFLVSGEPSSAYEVLESFQFPKGILPEGVQSYVLRPDGGFEVFVSSDDCQFSVAAGGYLLRYQRRITGTVKMGWLGHISGIEVRVLFAWLNIHEVVKNGDDLDFYIGSFSASFPVSNFEACPKCGCGFHCELLDQ